jgi:hypothetical protein
MRRFLLTLIFLGYAFIVFGQDETLQKESIVESCLNDKISLSDWNYLTDYFESYLVAGGFGKKDNIENAYLKFIEYRTGFPPKELPVLLNREGLKEKLLSLKIIDGSRTFGVPFVECFYLTNPSFNDYPQSTLKDIVSIAESISKYDLSSNIIMGGLKVSFKEADFKKNIYKRAVILLGLIDMVYMEELVQGQAKDDNPIYRHFQERQKQMTQAQLQLIKQDDQRLEKKPEPVGGYDKYFKWIYDNNKKLGKAKELGKYYRTIIQGEVDENGNLVNFGVWRGIGGGYDQEAHRLIKNHVTQKWTPGTIDGKPIRVEVEIEVDFRLE